MENVADYKEIIEVIKDQGGEVFKYCYQCGKCDTVCPWNKVTKDFSMRKVVRQAVFGMTEIETDEIWRCTTCGRCPDNCPRDVQQIKLTVALRRVATEYGVFPQSVKPIRSIVGSLAGDGNPLNGERNKRKDWAKGLGVPKFNEEMEILYFPGCYICYDPRMKKVGEATVKILKKAGVKFGILGEKENCCGESIRKTGEEELFRELAKENIKNFIDAGVKKIVVSSPHCYHTFKNEYPDFCVNFEVMHITQFIYELIQEGRLQLSGEYRENVTYHDPCYLGRHNKIFDEPREILNSIKGIIFRELQESRENSLCCGGGGGRVWMETEMQERFSNIRLEQALEKNANVLVTACPYCISMLEDSRVTMNFEDKIEIKDITEIVAEVI